MRLNVSENRFSCQDFSLTIPLDSLSIGRLLRQKLLALAYLEQTSQTKSVSEKITLYYLKSQIGYRSAIALQLAKGQTCSPHAIAEQLVKRLITREESDRTLLDFTVRVWESSWIDFYLSDRALAFWLQRLPQIFCPTLEKPVKEAIVLHLFSSQYIHARCCSLLRLGHREGLIELHELDFSKPVWQWKQPHPIPFLASDKFQLVRPTEQNLIRQILAVTDALDDRATENWIKLATNLSEAVLEFERRCRIWGEVKQETPELSQARLGLIAIAQLLLRQLLQEKIGVWAPAEL
jgi:arginyl-tRNA synthetase